MLVEDALRHGSDSGLLAEVAREAHGPSATRADGGRELVELVGRSCRQKHRRPRIGELARGGLADAEGRARDQNRGTVHCAAEALQVGNPWRIHERLDEFPSRANH
jgi:hypothetical protein